MLNQHLTLHRGSPPLIKSVATMFGTAALAAVIVAVPTGLQASSHREAPYILKYPQVDATDFYAFNSYESGRSGFVTLLANYSPAQAAYGGPNYFPLDENALYEIHIDNDGDALQDLTFQFDFSNDLPIGGGVTFEIGTGDNQRTVASVLRNAGQVTSYSAPGQSYVESYEVKVVGTDKTSRNISNVLDESTRFAKPFDNVGSKTYPNGYSTYANSFVHDMVIPGCDDYGRVFVGQRLDPFKIALGEVFDLVNFDPIGIQQDPDRNALQRNNITTLALELPTACITGAGNGVIGAWTTASLRKNIKINSRGTLDNPEKGSGPFTQVSRLGSILVNELFIGFPDKNTFNASAPKDDTQFLTYVTHPVFPAIISSLFGGGENIAPVNIPRTDLVAGFLTGFPGVNQLATVTPSEVLRLNTEIGATVREAQQSLGVVAGDLAGFPNGRRPGDDAVDIALRVAMGALCHPVAIDLNGNGVIGDAGDNLGLCSPGDAPVGNVALTDGVPISAADFNNSFPYLVTPYPGSPTNAAIPGPDE